MLKVLHTDLGGNVPSMQPLTKRGQRDKALRCELCLQVYHVPFKPFLNLSSNLRRGALAATECAFGTISAMVDAIMRFVARTLTYYRPEPGMHPQ